MKKIPRIGIRAKVGNNCFITFMKAVIARTSEVDLGTMAGSLAFTTVLSIAPLLAVMFYVFKIFGGLDYAYARLEPFLLHILSEGTGKTVADHLSVFIRHVHAKAVGWAGFAGLLMTALLTYSAVVKSFNRIWSPSKSRVSHMKWGRAFILLTAGPLLLTASIVVTTAVAARVKGVPFSGQVIAYVLSVILFILVYALVPTVKVPLKAISLGSLLPAALLEGAKYGYAIYTRRVVSYANFYGAFAAIPLFLLWIYIAWYITLFGAVWIYELQLHLKGQNNAQGL